MKKSEISLFMFQEACQNIKDIFNDYELDILPTSGLTITNYFATGTNNNNYNFNPHIGKEFSIFFNEYKDRYRPLQKAPKCQISRVNIGNRNIMLMNVHRPHNNNNQQNAIEVIAYIQVGIDFSKQKGIRNLIIAGDFNYDLSIIKGDIKKEGVFVVDTTEIYQDISENCNKPRKIYIWQSFTSCLILILISISGHYASLI